MQWLNFNKHQEVLTQICELFRKIWTQVQLGYRHHKFRLSTSCLTKFCLQNTRGILIFNEIYKQKQNG